MLCTNVKALFYCILVLIGFANTNVLAQLSLSEDQAKSALLYNFIKNTRWENVPDSEVFQVRFIGGDRGFYREFSKIAAEENIRGKSIAVSVSPVFQTGGNQHVLVLAQEFNAKLEKISSALAKSNTLLVTENTPASHKNLVMINFLLLGENIGFEVNRSNIILEGLTISKELLLYGGTEIEVAVLYKEMESSLIAIEEQLKNQKLELVDSSGKLRSSQSILHKQTLAITAKDSHLAEKIAELDRQQKLLFETKAQLRKNRSGLASGENLLRERAEKIGDLEERIRQKQLVLSSQIEEVWKLQSLIDKKSQRVVIQEDTIASQRDIIALVVTILLLFLTLIIFRQRKTLARERKLSEAESALVQAQSESIAAFESSIELKNDFLATTNHELRTPLNGILGAVQVTDRENLAELQSAMDLIEDCTGNMTSMVDDILTYTEIQSQQMENQIKVVSTEDYLLELKARYQRKCDEKSLSLNWNIDENIPSLLKFDGAKMLIVLKKILDNAVKFTDAGHVTFGLEIRGDGVDEHIVFTVSDSGCGFSVDARKHIYEAFWQSETGLTRSFDGLGIGLTLSKKLMQYMDGEIEVLPNSGISSATTVSGSTVSGTNVSGTNGSGTTVVMTLALTTVTEQEAIAHEAIAADAPDDSRDLAIQAAKVPSVLVVEDNIVNQLVLKKMLNKLGYQCSVASDGYEALAVIEELEPSLILMDLQMPNMDGFRCTEIIREKSQVPIVAVSANHMTSQQRKCFEVGMNECLGKPLTIQLLEKVLNNFIPLNGVNIYSA